MITLIGKDLAKKGQEFVFVPNEQALEWAKNIILDK